MSSELERAVADLEALALRRGRPTRYEARPVLLLLGAALIAGDAGAAGAVRGRIQALEPPFLEAWEAAVRDELSMAGTEHIRSVDPRYLDRPGYDFPYTIEARERLEARLRAAEYLGVVLDGALAAGIRRADALLESRRPQGRDSA